MVVLTIVVPSKETHCLLQRPPSKTELSLHSFALLLALQFMA